ISSPSQSSLVRRRPHSSTKPSIHHRKGGKKVQEGGEGWGRPRQHHIIWQSPPFRDLGYWRGNGSSYLDIPKMLDWESYWPPRWKLGGEFVSIFGYLAV
ncbi:hypothetical protein GDO81_009500, partial [Engystomops pustulosus]